MSAKKIRPIVIDGNCGLVLLTQGRTAIVDLADAEFVGQWNWRYSSGYAVRSGPRGPNGQEHIKMHRVLMAECDLIDHANGDGLDNRRSNLRPASHSENMRNCQKNRRNASGYKGVFFQKERGKWRAAIKHDRRRFHLGYFETPEAAHAAYCDASGRLHGEFGRTD